jgi:hypothetical protein
MGQACKSDAYRAHEMGTEHHGIVVDWFQIGRIGAHLIPEKWRAHVKEIVGFSCKARRSILTSRTLRPPIRR